MNLKLAAILLATVLVACGGGGSSAPTPTEPTTPTQPIPPVEPKPPEQIPFPKNLSLNGGAFSPGEKALLTGSNLDKIVSIFVGSEQAILEKTTDGVFILIPGTDANRITVNWQGGSESLPIEIKLPITANLISQHVIIGDKVVITGTNLQKVTDVKVSGISQNFKIIDQSSIEISVSFFGSISISTGYVTISGGTLIEYKLPTVSETQINVYQDEVLKITGNNLSNINKVTFNSKIVEFFISESGTLSFNISESGVYTLHHDRGTINITIRLILKPIITSTLISLHPAKLSATISGSNLDSITSIKIGSTDIEILEKSVSKISFRTLTEIKGCFPIEAVWLGGTITIGSWSDGTCNWSFEYAEIGQTLIFDERLQPTLIEGKEFTIIPKFIGVKPFTTLQIYEGVRLMTTMYSSTDGNIKVPAQYASKNFKYDLLISADNSSGPRKIKTLSLKWSTNSPMQITIVPIVVAGMEPSIPPIEEIKKEIYSRLPINSLNLSIVIREPYIVDYEISTLNEWQNALYDLANRKTKDRATGLYYGMFTRQRGSVLGIGFLSGVVALGVDQNYFDWNRTMVHELGHNFGRFHAPCGVVSNADASFPYPNGSMGPTRIFSPFLDTEINVSKTSDIMGYCNGMWFSDYNYKAITQYVGSVFRFLQDESSLIYSGTIKDNKISIANVVVGSNVNQGKVIGKMRMVTSSGTYEVDMLGLQIDHSDEIYWYSSVPIVGNIEKIEAITDMDKKTVVNSKDKLRITSTHASGWTHYSVTPKESKSLIGNKVDVYIKGTNVIVMNN